MCFAEQTKQFGCVTELQETFAATGGVQGAVCLLLIQPTLCCRQRMQRLFAASQTASKTAATMLAQTGGTLQVS